MRASRVRGNGDLRGSSAGWAEREEEEDLKNEQGSVHGSPQDARIT